jgi:ketol-acid reductoisomerase
MPLDVFTEADADLSALAGTTIAVVGFGNLGSSMAETLRDAGLTVVVGNRDDEYRERAVAAGFVVADVASAVAQADVVYVLISDEATPGCFQAHIAPVLRAGSALCFASGYCLAFGLVAPPDDVDVLLLAPRMVGSAVHRATTAGSGYVAYVSVERDVSGVATERLLALALAAGALKRGAFVVSAADEAAIDLLVEQTVGPYLGLAVQLAFEVGVEGGLAPEAMVLELYQSGEMAETFRSFAERGFYRSVGDHGVTAQYGGYARRLQSEGNDGYPALALIEAITAGDDPMSRAESAVEAALAKATISPTAPE